MTFWDLFFPVGPDISMAAFMGTTAWLLLGKKMDKTQMIMTVVANYLISVYMTGLVAEISGWKSMTGIAFLIATGGLKLVERFVDQLFEKITNNINKGNNGTDTDSAGK